MVACPIDLQELSNVFTFIARKEEHSPPNHIFLSTCVRLSHPSVPFDVWRPAPAPLGRPKEPAQPWSRINTDATLT